MDPNMTGVVRLDEIGTYAVIANRTLHGSGTAGRFAVANTREHWVDSVHEDHAAALAVTRKLSTN